MIKIRNFSFYAITVLLFTTAVLAIYGQTFLVIVSVVLSLIVALWQHFGGEFASQRQESLNQTQAQMMVRGGLGNLYVESVRAELDQVGCVIDAESRLKEALAIDPSDLYALSSLAIGGALAISDRKAQAVPIHPAEMRRLKQLCRRGRKLHSAEASFLNALGVLADAEGSHDIARLWFTKAGALSAAGDPYWRLYVATSYALSGDHQKSLQEIERAKNEGAAVWFVDLYMGRALCSNGRYEDALPFLYAAKSARPRNWQVITWLRSANVCLGRLWKAGYYGTILALLIFISRPLHAFGPLLEAAVFWIALIVGRLRRGVYLLLSKVIPNCHPLFRILGPDELEVGIWGASGFLDSPVSYFRGACWVSNWAGETYPSEEWMRSAL